VKRGAKNLQLHKHTIARSEKKRGHPTVYIDARNASCDACIPTMPPKHALPPNEGETRHLTGSLEREYAQNKTTSNEITEQILHLE